jgi:hypothetical protein
VQDSGWWTAEGASELSADPDRRRSRVYSLLALELAVRLLPKMPLKLPAPGLSLREFSG